MKQASKLGLSALAMGLILASGSALAYEKGNIVVRAGLAMVDPQDDSTELTLNGASLDGTSVTVDDDTQLGLTLTYMVTDKVGVSLLGATPFKHTVTAKGAPVDNLKTAEVKHLPPTITVQYFPMDAQSAFQPYVGIGLNYTTFFQEELTSDFKDALGDGNIKLDDSFGYALQVGADYKLSNNVVLNASIWTIDIDTTATIDLESGSQIKTDVDIDPMVYMVGVGYQF
ncbi:OmpW/AlkL family protein [Hahella ganghwensis]|uniref:OmpW/AlkL family protein n=1 Tax=Hahella ganghwensis TaxID=286420 RepID=UPI00036154D0|nr:OmpW family outer membrane protein [Hahella ganghwensis]